jgi:FixJ family two-component response regulator
MVRVNTVGNDVNVVMVFFVAVDRKECLVDGHANKVIAYDLGISPRTVEIHRANLMTKTGARNMAELMRLALAAGL